MLIPAILRTEQLVLEFNSRRYTDEMFYFSGVSCDNSEWLNDNLPEMTDHFNCVSFDNLALKQLDVRRLMKDEEWNEFYIGDDGKYTFYIDMVENKFARNSVSDARYDTLDNIDEMFEAIRKENRI